MIGMILLITRIYQNVIDEHNHKHIQILSEHPIHQIHKSGRSVSYSKGQYNKLIMARHCTKSIFRNITFPHPQLVISGTKVYFREVTCSLELIKQIINSRQRLSLLDSYLIQLSVVNAHAKRTILLPHK